MEFGMFSDFHVRKGVSQAEAFEESFNQVDVAEELGMDSIWLAEVHFNPDRSVLAAPLIIASAIAARTTRMRIGLAVQLLPLTNPLRVAEEAAMVDHISKGRFDFGIGRSSLTKYYQGYNIPYSESRGRFLEALEVILKAWGEEQFSYAGEYYSYQNVTVVPKPYQQPYPPTRVAAISEDTFSLIGQLGYPIFTTTITPIAQLRERLALYREARHDAGHSGPDDVTLQVPAYVAETAEEARSEPEASTIFAIQSTARELIPSAASQEIADSLQRMADTPYEDILKQRVMYGTPEAVVERFQEYREELGISGVVLEMNYGGQIPYGRVVNSMRLLTEEVMPKFK